MYQFMHDLIASRDWYDRDSGCILSRDELCDIITFLSVNNNNNNNNNNTSICKAHNVSIRAESEAPIDACYLLLHVSFYF